MAVVISDAAVTNRAPSAAIKWVKPVPLWASQDTPLGQPWLAEFDGDRFLPDFLDLMASQTPADLASDTYKPKLTILDDGKSYLKLYQPLHGRYYLVTGSLVCRKLGLPDRSVVRKNGEKTSFVLRRLLENVEYGWVKDSTVPSGGSWQPVGSNSLLKNEERQPMHPVKTCAPLALSTGIVPTPVGQTICDQRTVYYGYIPVASREKYLMPIADPIGTLQNVIDAGGPNPLSDPRLDDLSTRVIEPWLSFYMPNNPPVDQQDSISFYLLLDMLDFLQNNLPSVFNALGTDGTSLDSSDHTQRKALFTELKSIIKDKHQAGTTDTSDVFLSDLLNGLKPYLPLVQSQQGNEPTNLSAYNLHAAQHDVNHDPANRDWENVNAAYLALPPSPPATTPAEGPFYTFFRNALDEEKQERKKNNQPWLTVPDEVKDILKDDPPNGDTYCLRLVYEHDPCTPVVSERSDSFTFAKAVDPDAPARHIRIELPSIKLKDLRKFKRGVGMQSSCEMNKLTNQLMSIAGLDGLKSISPPGPCPPDLSIGWICSFSLQILFIIAFILMFIFLIVLNIVFWWIAFFRICFPIPVPKK